MSDEVVPFSELVDLSSKPIEPIQIVDTSVGINFPRGPNKLFVEPSLTKMEAHSSPKVLLVTAPAAVGKSTVARELAVRTGAAIWNLQGRRVSDNSFSGGIFDAFGPGSAGNVYEGLRNGTMVLILDAIEESEQLSGELHFIPFLRNMCAYFRDTDEPHSLIVFAREDTTVLRIVLDDQEVAYDHWRIDYFDQTRAFEFIDKKASYLCAALKRSPDVNSPMFHNCKALAFEILGKCVDPDSDVWKSDAARQFVGYAPVLEALTSYLIRDPNLVKVENELKSKLEGQETGGAKKIWELINEIVSGILSREQTKLIDPLKVELETKFTDSGWADWEQLYTPEEQILRVLGRVHGIKLRGFIPTDFPRQGRDQYSDSVNQWFNQHPFLDAGNPVFASRVFQEYCYAFATTQHDNEIMAAVRNTLLDPSYVTVPMLARFVMHIDVNAAANIEETVTEARKMKSVRVRDQDIGFVIESLLTRSLEDVDLAFEILPEISSDHQDADHVCYVNDSDKRTQLQSTYEINIKTDVGYVHFPRKIRNVVAEVQGGVLIGVSGGSVKIGPAVSIVADEIEFLMDALFVETKESEPVILIASRARPQPRTRIETHGTGEFAVNWKNIWGEWGPYRMTEVNYSPDATPELQNVFCEFCKMLRTFGGKGYGGLAKYKLHVEKKARTSADGMALLKYMLHSHLLTEDQNFYYLSEEKASSLGITHLHLMSKTMGDGVRAFLEEGFTHYKAP